MAKRIGKVSLEREVIEATAIRAVYGNTPADLEFTFRTSFGEVIQLTLPFKLATEFLNESLAAHSTAAPKVISPRGGWN
jgi:hypothetical protein